MAEFKDRLKELIKEKSITAEKLAKELPPDKYISANTIRNYIKDNHKPTNIKNIQILADYFNVSIDYIQGFTKVKTNNVDIKTICDKYGLSEETLTNLEKLNSTANNKILTKINLIINIMAKN